MYSYDFGMNSEYMNNHREPINIEDDMRQIDE